MAHPTGTVSFLFTDIEGSTQLWEERREEMSDALAEHDRIIRQAVESQNGRIFSTGGDGVAAAFQLAGDALGAALHAQDALANACLTVPLRVRMAVHTGEVEDRAGDYFGPPLNRTARLMAAAHGGQVLTSVVTATLAAGQLPVGAMLVDMGEHRLRDLTEPEHVFQLAHPALRKEFPPLRSLDHYPGNLPIQPTAFVGRHDAITDVAKALEAARVVTLSGVGGVGKTRLALQVAADVVHRFRDGAWSVELAPVGSAESFPDAVVQALGVRPPPGATPDQTIRDFLQDKELLLVLDNCEHLLSTAAEFVDTVVRRSAGVCILSTSREGLGVPGERTITVAPLETPAPDSPPAAILASEAVRLFVERAREANAGFSGTDQEAVVLAELCRRLDGIPLAIELAAARMTGMTPTEILSHLDRRFRVLTRGRRTATTRHQTLRNTLDWSYDLLHETEQRVLRRLAVFAGDFSLASAEVVVADDDLDDLEVVDHLVRLVEKSLVAVDTRLGRSRYRLLETIRDYAWERLESADELDGIAERHARYYGDMAAEVGSGLESADEVASCQRAEEDLENFRAAFRWAVDNADPDLALRLLDSLMPMCWLRSPPFGGMARNAAEMPTASDHPLRPMALGMVCQALTQEGAIDEALRYADAAEDETQRLLVSPEHAFLRCRVQGFLTTVIALAGQNDRLVNLARRGLEDARAVGRRFEAMRFLIMLASAIPDEDHSEAVRAGEEALALAREFRVPSYLAWAPMMLAGRLSVSDPSRAESLLVEAAKAAEYADNPFAQFMARLELASSHSAQGDYTAAATTVLDQLDSCLAIGDRSMTLQALGPLVPLLAKLGERDGALLIGAWIENHGVVPYKEMNPTYVRFHGADYVALRNTISSEERTALALRADEFDERGLADLARQCVRSSSDRR